MTIHRSSFISIRPKKPPPPLRRGVGGACTISAFTHKNRFYSSTLHRRPRISILPQQQPENISYSSSLLTDGFSVSCSRIMPVSKPLMFPPSGPLKSTSRSVGLLAPYRSYFEGFDEDEESLSLFDYDSDDDDMLHEEKNSCKSSNKLRRKVKFASRIQVVEIPNRQAYSRKMKDAMWTTRKQIKRKALQSAIEYAWEGRDWRSAVEENDFVYVNGERVHPALVEVRSSSEKSATTLELPDVSEATVSKGKQPNE